MSDRVVQDSKGRMWLITTLDGIERHSYLGRDRTDDEIEDLKRWCRGEGIDLILLANASDKARLADVARRARRTDALLRRSLQPAGSF